MARVNKYCKYCSVEIRKKDVLGLNKKILEQFTSRGEYLCLSCMADFLECSIDDLIEKIEEFKNTGCKLFF